MAKTRKIPRVIRTPDAILRVKGIMDSGYSASVADAYVQKLYAKCSAKEADEVRSVENELHDVRKAAANCLAVFFGNFDALSSCRELCETDSKTALREFRRLSAQKNMLRSGMDQAKTDLVMYNEMIVSSNVLLEERLLRMRKQRDRKLSAYLMGMRHEQSDYELPLFEDDTPMKTYLEKHRFLDDAVAAAAAAILRHDTEEGAV